MVFVMLMCQMGVASPVPDTGKSKLALVGTG